MRTTIDLPEDLHRLATNIARDKHQTLSQVVTDLMRNGVAVAAGPGALENDPVTGLLVMSGSGRPITQEDVRALDDDA